jgi:hypothetical protein
LKEGKAPEKVFDYMSLKRGEAASEKRCKVPKKVFERKAKKSLKKKKKRRSGP